jgi:hypothetical protein
VRGNQQQSLWPVEQVDTTAPTFGPNMSEPIHRWFRFSAGFSAAWASQVIVAAKRVGSTRVLDPFAGSGTTLLEAECSGAEAIGLESQPFVAKLARAKLLWRTEPAKFEEQARYLLNAASSITPETTVYPPLIHRCFSPQSLAELDQLRRAIYAKADPCPERELCWFALAAILRSCSPVGTASWQYVLPKKTKATFAQPKVAFLEKVREMVADMRLQQHHDSGPPASLVETDARNPNAVPEEWATLVVTSPPYANNFDYADSTRLEMSFFLDVRGWGDLQRVARHSLVRSCTQHVAALPHSLSEILASPELEPISPEIHEVCERLAEIKSSRGGKKPYDLMVASYFADLAVVWKNIRRWSTPRARACFVIGDSAPYGVHVPVDRWLGLLAQAAGFSTWHFEKLRDRNTKWKNRKHRVPLHEGVLWVE